MALLNFGKDGDWENQCWCLLGKLASFMNGSLDLPSTNDDITKNILKVKTHVVVLRNSDLGKSSKESADLYKVWAGRSTAPWQSLSWGRPGRKGGGGRAGQMLKLTDWLEGHSKEREPRRSTTYFLPRCSLSQVDRRGKLRDSGM